MSLLKQMMHHLLLNSDKSTAIAIEPLNKETATNEVVTRDLLQTLNFELREVQQFFLPLVKAFSALVTSMSYCLRLRTQR